MTENEQLRNNIEVVFSYARTYVANANPSAENEMLAMINIKAEILEKLKLISNKEQSILEPKIENKEKKQLEKT